MPEPVKPVVGVFTREETLFAGAVEALAARLGEPDYISPLLNFDQTAYYTREMGPGLRRRIYAFPRLIDPGDLASLKRWTNQLEDTWRVGGKRQVNIDPGYLSLAKLVLATTKDNVHRIYLGDGIYAEVTLFFRKGRFHPWPWTYPDYASEEYRAIFEHIRELYRKQL
uniref:DUF4416 family protein n=1 Tax=Ammonifex degensii TaxID=42838 RepID=A0A7C2E2C8_9THEO